MKMQSFTKNLNMKQILLAVLIMALALTACANDAKEPEDLSAAEQTAITTELTVWGMSCERCANSVEKAVSALDGVIDVSVALEAEKVTVKHEPTLDVDTIKNSITAEGYSIP